MAEGCLSSLQTFQGLLDAAERYPLNLAHSQELRSVIRSCNALIQSNWLYEGVAGSLWTWFTQEDGTELSAASKIDDLVGVQKLLNTQEKDPLCQYLYIQNSTSRTGLGCTRDQLSWILSYYQVFPAIADQLAAFDPVFASVPLDTLFQARSTLRKAQPRLDLSQLGRSNFRFEYCFRLIGIEKNGDKLTEFQHAAAYHSMDVKKNRSIWLIFKARDELRKQIEEESQFYLQQNPEAWSSVQTGFLANMNTNLALFKWCSRNWTEHLDDLGARMRPMEATVTLPRMDEILNEHTLRHRDTSMTRYRRATGLSQVGRPATTKAQPESRLRRYIRWLAGRRDKPGHRNDANGTALQTLEPIETRRNARRADAWFNFDALQSQHDLLNDCGSSLGALKSNIRILQNYQTHIRQLTTSNAFKQCVKMGDRAEEVHERLEIVKTIEADLQSFATRLDRLIKALENTISLFTSVLNYKEVRVAEHFTRHAQDSTTKMEILTEEMHDIAKTTELQTVSMHIITAVALFFLPVTFVASFFDSNILDFSKAEKRKLGQWTLNLGALSLFFYVSIPIMVVIILFWVLAFCWHRKKRIARPETGRLIDPENQTSR